MNREKAEKLLAALIFDDLDTASKAELTAYLETDDELRERLADMRMTVKVTADAIQNEPERTLDKKRLEKLSRLAGKSNNRPVIFTMRYLITAAAVLAMIALPAYLVFIPTLSKAKFALSNQSMVMSDSESAYQDGRHGLDFAGGTSLPIEVASEEIGYQHSAATSTESDKQIAQVFEHEYQYGSDIQGSDIYSYWDNGTNGPGSGVTYEDYASSVSDSSAPPSRISNMQFQPPEITISDSSPFATNRSQASDAFVVMGRGGRGVPTDSIEDITRSYNSFKDSPDVDGQFTLGWGVDGIDAPTGGPLSGGELSLRLDSLGVTEEDGRTTAGGRELESEPLSRPQTAPVRTRSRASTTVTTPTSPAAKPAPPTEPIPGSLGGAFDVSGPERRIQAKLEAEIVELPQAVQNQLNGDTIVIGKKLNNERSVSKGSELSNEGIESIKLDSADFDGDAVAEGEAKVPVLGDIPIIGGLYKRESAKDTAVKEYRRSQEVAVLNEQIRTPREEERAKAVSDYMDRALRFQEEQRYEDALGQLEQALTVDPQNQQAKITKQALEHTVKYIEQRRIKEETDREEVALLMDKQKGPIPFSKEINFPRNWKEISERRREFLGEESNADIPVEDITDLPLASRFKSVPVNPWVMTERDSLSTFALDVDTASYTLSRRYINSGFLPPAGAVRMEEFINYFNYQYPQQSDRTFRVHAEAAPAPFAARGKNLTLLKIGVKARTVGRDQQKPAHLVFVIDTSASMGKAERLPLIQQALNMLIDRLTPSDRVTLITCSDQARLHLDSVPVSQRERIRQVINALQPSGTTNLLAGLQLGYATARRSYSAKQINQIVLCSDGVANVGQTEAEAVLKAVAQDRKQGITITCVGVGYGTYNDAFMESLANQGDGRYVFLDSLRQAQRVFVEQLAATLHTVAKDARIQVSFNPEHVRRYRLIGYENRDIEDERFRDDTIDAGEVGSGQCSTALYELELTNQAAASQIDDLGTVFVRYRDVDTGQVEEVSCDLEKSMIRTRTVENSPYFYLAAAAAQFAEILRQSEHVQGSNLTDVLRVAEKVGGVLPLDRDVRELADLIRKSEQLPRAQ